MFRYYHTLPGAAIVHRGHTGSVVRDYGRWRDETLTSSFQVVGILIVLLGLYSFYRYFASHFFYWSTLYAFSFKQFKTHKFHFQDFKVEE